MRTALLALAVGLTIAAPALAGQPVLLKASTVDADGIVTLADLFDRAGPAGRTQLAYRTTSSVVLNAQIVQAIARRAGLDWSNAEGLKTIVVTGEAAGSGGAPSTQRTTNIDVLNYARNIAPGEIIAAEDLIWGKAAAGPADAPRDPDAIIGLAARRPLRAGAAAHVRDVAAPQVIKAGETVTVSFQAQGVALSLQGKALAAAGVGETLNVENTSSKKIIQAVAIGPGQAVVGPAADALKPADFPATRIALR